MANKEIGSQVMPVANFWSNYFAIACKNLNLAFSLVWRNPCILSPKHNTSKYYCVYANEATKSDFIDYLNLNKSSLLKLKNE